MGGTNWSDDHYTDRVTTRAKTGAPTFGYSAAIASGAAPAKTHASLDPTKMKAGARGRGPVRIPR